MPSRIGKAISAAFDLSLATAFLITWMSPNSGLAQPAGFLLLIMLIEFITTSMSNASEVDDEAGGPVTGASPGYNAPRDSSRLYAR